MLRSLPHRIIEVKINKAVQTRNGAPQQIPQPVVQQTMLQLVKQLHVGVQRWFLRKSEVSLEMSASLSETMVCVSLAEQN